MKRLFTLLLLLCVHRALAVERAAAEKPAPTHANVSYGPHERNVLDVWLPGGIKPTSPAPLVVYIHGGGFTGGQKNIAGNQPQLLAECATRGWVYAAINYRYAKDGLTILDSMQDGKRAVQYLRHRATEWGIDKQRIALYGGSAGTGMSLWIGLQDDLADPASDDPVLRESTRVSAIGMINGQISYDRQEWLDVIFKGMALAPQFKAPREDKQRDPAVSMLKFISADDPPIFAYSYWPDTPPQEAAHYAHHPRHGMEAKRRYDALGLRCELRLVTGETENKNDQAKAVGYAQMIEFFASIFTPVKP